MKAGLGDSAGGRRVSVLRRTALVWVIAAVALGAVAPTERAIALDPVANRAGVPALTRAASTGAQAAQSPAPVEEQPWTAIVAVAVAGAAAIVLLVVLFARNLARLARSTVRGGSTKPEEFFVPAPRRAEAPTAPEPAPPPPEPSAPPQQPEPPVPAQQPQPPAVTAGPAPASGVAALEGPRREAGAQGRARRGDHDAPAPPRKARPAAARSGPVCQVHWIERGARFCAMITDADGVEHRLASSPRIASPGASPPEQTAEAQRALRQLAKELRDRGWKPLRAKGTDFDEPQWYARRFKRPPPDTRTDGAEGTAAPTAARPG